MCDDSWKLKFRLFYQRVESSKRNSTSSVEGLTLWADGYDAALDAVLLAIEDFVGESKEEMTR